MMDHLSLPLNTVASLPFAIQIPLAAVATAFIVVATTRIYTTILYRRALAQHFSSPSSKTATLSPPPIPYSIPFLGSALSFLAPKPGIFWSWLFQFNPSSVGCCTLRLGPRVAHILYNPASVQAVFKSKDTSRFEFNATILRTSLGLQEEDVRKYYGLNKKGMPQEFDNKEDDPNETHEKINMEMLLKSESSNELTRIFVKFLEKELDKVQDIGEVGLYKWVQAIIFEASGRTIMGEKIFEYYPNLGEDFWDYDRTMLSLFLGIPEIFLPEAVKFRERSISGVTQWHEGMEKGGLNEIVDPGSTVPWEPNYGSRANRARQQMYKRLDLSRRASAGLDLGFLFGIASNSIPATGWVLMHILDPNASPTLLPRVMTELETVKLPNGSVDINKLLALPLLQAIFNEVLRLYSDLLVTRSLNADITLPLDAEGHRKLALSKDTLTIAPTWLSHRDPEVWNSPPQDIFCPERWLTTTPETGKDVFTTAGRTGHFFPFGGGKGMCPGRVFAKQEVFAAAALVLLNFEFEVKGFVDRNGNATEKFPGLREGFGGSGIMVHDGDVKVGIKRREK